MEHIIDSENKYKSLRQNMDQKIVESGFRLLKLDNENKRYSAVKEFLLNKLEDLKNNHDTMVINFDTMLQEFNFLIKICLFNIFF